MNLTVATRVFFAATLTLLLGVLVVSGYRYGYLRDFMLSNEVECDPAAESCFVRECDPEEEECTGDPAEDTTFYSIAVLDARYVDTCDPHDDSSCVPFDCSVENGILLANGEQVSPCELEFCEEANVPEGERCSTAADAPPEEVLGDEETTETGLDEVDPDLVESGIEDLIDTGAVESEEAPAPDAPEVTSDEGTE